MSTILGKLLRAFLAVTSMLLLSGAQDAGWLDTSPILLSGNAPAFSLLPRRVQIPMPDGQLLAGTYYPPRDEPAPVVVLMHWAAGDKRDWTAIAPWLQNSGRRYSGLEQASLAPMLAEPWRDPQWFPDLPADQSYAVLTFDFECFSQSDCYIRNGIWLQDALAAVEFASRLEGVDSDAIVTVGASIGADGAIDGCYLFNLAVAAGQAQGQCRGALSLSPGSYLTTQFRYYEAAQSLLEAGHVVYCFGSDGDGTARSMCRKTPAGANFRSFNYSGKPHGMQLLDPSLQPNDADANALQLLLDFLSEAAAR